MEDTNMKTTKNPSLQKWLLSFISEQKKTFLVSDQKIEEKDAFFHYNKGDFSQAAQNFLKLLANSPEEKKYWLYFALSLQNEKKYDKALNVWSILAKLDAEDPIPHFHAAKCLFSLQQKNLALLALNAAKKQCLDSHPLFEKIQTLHQELSL